MSSLLRQLLLGAGLLAALVGWYLISQARLHAAQRAASQAQAHAAQLQSALTAAKQDQRIVTHYVDRVHTIHARGRTLIRQVPVYVPTPASPAAAVAVPRGFVRLYNAAAQGTDLPASPGAAYAQPSGLALAAVARTTVDNFGACHVIAQQLTSLQQWVRIHSDHDPPPVTP